MNANDNKNDNHILNIRQIRKEKQKKSFLLLISCIAVFVVCILLVFAFLPGRIKETDKGIIYQRFGKTAKNCWLNIKDETYFFDRQGCACTGWNTIEDKMFYFDEKGRLQRNWLEIDEKKFYLDEDSGELVKGFYFIENAWYYFSEEDGAMKSGRQDIDNHKYFFENDGRMIQGWGKAQSGESYYSNKEGHLLTGIQKIDEKNYYFDGNGVLQYGWIKLEDGKRYYADEKGAFVTGDQQIEGITYSFDENGLLVKENTTNMKMIALTFDDGPSLYTDQILNVLQQYNCKATFFIVGSRVDKFSTQLKRIAEVGCEIGSHTYYHRYLTEITEADIKSEVDMTNAVVTKYIGKGTTCLRPPGGMFNDVSIKIANCSFILWNVDTKDWKSRNPQEIINIATTNIQDGDIILMHDLYATTAEAINQIVPKLLEQGFKLVTVSELLESKGGAINGKAYYSATKMK